MTTVLKRHIHNLKKATQSGKKGFTLVEMLIVLLVISVLILLFVPNLSQHRNTIDEKGNEAVVKVVDTQIELFRLKYNREPVGTELVDMKYISNEQYEIYQNRPRLN